MIKIGASALLALAMLAAPAARAATTLQVSPDALCGPGGCFGAGNTYSKTWSATSGGRVDISSLLLDRSLLGDRQDLAVRVGFTLADGTKVGDWGAFTVSVLNGQVVRLGGEGFTWDQSRGDLVLTLQLIVPEKGAGGGFGGGGFGGRGFGGGESPDLTGLSAPGGRPAGFTAPAMTNLPAVFSPGTDDGHAVIAAVPEPATWAMILAGFGAAGGMLRIRRRLGYS